MRLNQFIARSTGQSRRAADLLIQQGRVIVNKQESKLGQDVSGSDEVTLDGQLLLWPDRATTIMLNKPVGYVCSRAGQGAKTIYDLLPASYHHLKPVGRLDKDSSGLLIMTDDGQLANQLTHPRYQKEKVYEVTLNKPLRATHQQQLLRGVLLDDGPSKFSKVQPISDCEFRISLNEGRNRQIRRTFAALGHKVNILHRTILGDYKLEGIKIGKYKKIL